jgi:hypothetical protein
MIVSLKFRIVMTLVRVVTWILKPTTGSGETKVKR